MPDDTIRLVHASGECEIDLARRELRVLGLPVPVGGRAFEIIEVLAQAAGKLVTKDELMKRIWPGATVSENTLHVHTAAVRKALGPNRSLLKTESGRGYRLLGDWTVRRHDAARPPVGLQRMRIDGASPVTNFPVAVTRLVGRTAAVARVRDFISAYRVVTLTGPGGIGKTSLALKAARGILGEYADGGWFVELAPLSDRQLVGVAVARGVGLQLEANANPDEAVAGAIGDKRILLVLDNCEHVIDAAASLAEALLMRCPNVAILATSREGLGIEGEFLYRVPALEVPATDQMEAEQILAHSGPELFITRIKQLDSDFAVEARNLPTIAAICRHVDGIPLAIEFAAARAATLGVDQVASGLGNRFALLTSGRRTVLPRHRTLRGTLDWSYQLLEGSEQLLLRHLAVFPARFTFEAVIAVMKDTGFDNAAVRDGIAGLVAKSLAAIDKKDPTTGWYLLETTRAYAFEKLVELGEASAAARHHAAFFRDLAMRLAPLSDFDPRSEGLAECFREIDNIRVALDWAFSSTGDVETGIAITAAYVPTWLKYSMMVECRERAEQALNCLDPIGIPDAYLRIRLLLGLGIALNITLGPVERNEFVLRTAFELAERCGNFDAQFLALWGLWTIRLMSQGMGQEPLATAEQLFSLAGRGRSSVLLTVAHRALGWSLHGVGDHSGARRHFEWVLEFDTEKSHEQEVWFPSDQQILARSMLARTLLLQGFVEQAEFAAQTSLTEALEGSSKRTLFIVIAFVVVPIALMTGDLDAGDRAVTLLVDAAATLGLKQYARTARQLQASLMMARGEWQSGVALLSVELESAKNESRNNAYLIYVGRLSEGLAALGQRTRALATLEEALEITEASGQRWDVPELLRIKGEVLLKRSEEASITAAEDCFSRATKMAREHGALYWELRIALSLARLRVTQGREDEVGGTLLPVYERFTEGFATADLRAARTMLDALSGHAR